MHDKVTQANAQLLHYELGKKATQDFCEAGKEAADELRPSHLTMWLGKSIMAA